MTLDLHPLARSARTIRVLAHTIVDLVDLLEADAFSLDGEQVVIRRHGRGSRPAMAWEASLGDWLVLEDGRWSVVADPRSSSPEIDQPLPRTPTRSSLAQPF